MAHQDYFQINVEAHPETDRLKSAFSKLPPDQQAAIRRLERELPDDAKSRFDEPLKGLGRIGMLELLCKIALIKKSHGVGGTMWSNLGSMGVVKRALTEEKRR